MTALKFSDRPDHPRFSVRVVVSLGRGQRSGLSRRAGPTDRVRTMKIRGLVLLGLCLTLNTCRAFPNQLPALSTAPPGLPPLSDPLLEYEQLDQGPGGGGPRGCGPCEPDLCPETRGCRAGRVPGSCGCCQECGNLEGQDCDQGNRSVFYGLCGTGLRCQGGGGGVGGEEDEDQQVCVCEQLEVVCGSDGRTYMNMCQFREEVFSRPELVTRGRGPCKTGNSPVCVSPVCLHHTCLCPAVSSHGLTLT